MLKDEQASKSEAKSVSQAKQIKQSVKFDESSEEEEPEISKLKYKTEKSVKLFNDNRTESDIQSP